MWFKILPSIKEGDIHCWLEDDKGNIYDHIQDRWIKNYRDDRKLSSFRFEKASKEDLLEELDFEYVCYSEIVCQSAKKFYEEEEKGSFFFCLQNN